MKVWFAVILTVLASSSTAAQTSISSDISADTTWGAAIPCPIVLEFPIFVRNGATLTILPGCVVRAQPQRGPAVDRTQLAGALIVTQNGRLNAVGSANAPIVFTTAAVDNDANAIADDAGGFLVPWAPGDSFLDAAPTTDPLAPLNPQGAQTAGLWGGVIVLGNAPTNLGNAAPCTAGAAGESTLVFSLFPLSALDLCYGGRQPHDNSGTLSFVSIRHTGANYGEDTMDCLRLAGVGDGTKISHIECTTAFDDGLSIEGGTVRSDHVAVFFAGDDGFDIDEGHVGVHQFWFGIMPHFLQGDQSPYGESSGDTACEFDGDDFGTNVELRSDGTPWPFSGVAIFNMTIVGPVPDPGVTPGGVFAAPFPSRICELRNGFAGEIFNSIIVNGGFGDGIEVFDGAGSTPPFDATVNAANDLIAIHASTFDDVGGPTAPTSTALANGDAKVTRFGGLPGVAGQNCYNSALAPASVLVDERWVTLNPSPPFGRLIGPVSFDPRPSPGLCTFGGVNPFTPGVDSSATYRGAFQPGQPLWTDGWTTPSLAGLF